MTRFLFTVFLLLASLAVPKAWGQTTPSPGPSDCCDLTGDYCVAPSGGACASGDVLYNASCNDPNDPCVTHTPTATPVNTNTPTVTRTGTITPTPSPTLPPSDRVNVDFGRNLRFETVSVNPASIGANVTGETHVDLPGVAPHDLVSCSPPLSLAAGLAAAGTRVVANSRIVVVIANVSEGAVDGAAQDWECVIFKFNKNW